MTARPLPIIGGLLLLAGVVNAALSIAWPSLSPMSEPVGLAGLGVLVLEVIDRTE